MATRKKNEEQAEGQQMENQAMENNQENNAPVSGSEQGEANLPAELPQAPEALEERKTPETSAADVPVGNETANDDSPVLEKLNVLADRFRIPAWQQAALLRYTGWMDDKLVTAEEYKRELENLKNRRIGGGRR